MGDRSRVRSTGGTFSPRPLRRDLGHLGPDLAELKDEIDTNMGLESLDTGLNLRIGLR